MITEVTLVPALAPDLLEILPALVAYIDSFGRYRRMSRTHEQWCGLSRERCLDRHYAELLPVLYGQTYACEASPHLERALDGCDSQFETRIANAAGVRDVRVSYAPDRDKSGRVRGVIELVTDISGLKTAGEEGTTSAERLQLAAEASNLGFWDVNLIDNSLDWNPACFRVLGFEGRSVPPCYQEFLARIHPEDRERRSAAFAAAHAKGGPYQAEFRVRLPDGSWRWIGSRGHFISGADGHSVRAVGIVFDITAVKTATQQVARQTQRIDQILESTTDGVLMLDRDARILYLNSRAKSILHRGDDLLGLSLWEAFPHAKARKFGEQYESVLRERCQTTFEEYYPEPLARWFEVHAYPIEEGVAAFFRDITDRRSAEELLRLQEQAIAAVPVGISIALCDAAADYPLVYVNPAFEEMTGYAAAEVLGRNCRFLQGPDTDPAARLRLREAIEKGEPARVALRNFRKDGTEFINEIQLSPVRNQQGQITHLVGTQSDVTDRVLAAQRLLRQAQYDTLTDLPNHHLFQELLKQALKSLCRRKNRQIALVYLDVDNLKHVNKALGHHGGDRFLRQISQRIRSAVRETDTVARIGSDEFALLFTDYNQRADIEKLIDRVLRKIAAPYRVAGRELLVTASAGYAVAPTDATTAEDLLRKADLAMYNARRECRNTWKPYHPSMESGHKRVLDIAAGLRHALKRDEFTLVYQPRIDAASGRLHSMEALIRWQHPERGLVYPGDFIPAAEETGLIVEIGRWVIEEAIRQLADWQARRYAIVPISVNVSAAQFRNPTFPETIRKALDESGVSPNLLEIELTESIFMDASVSNELLRALRTLGVRVAIDDFGTGYSGLGYLGRFSIDILKIDRAFTCAIEQNRTSASICRSILQLAQELRLTTVAEGVETPEQACLLREWGCDQLQGYHFGRPMPPTAMESFLPTLSS